MMGGKHITRKCYLFYMYIVYYLLFIILFRSFSISIPWNTIDMGEGVDMDAHYMTSEKTSDLWSAAPP